MARMIFFSASIPNFGGEISPDRKSIFISAPAKINLFLKILGKRRDGYHNIFSWFQALDLADRLEIEQTGTGDIVIETDSDDIPTGPENLVYQAARIIRDRFAADRGFNVKLGKQIPVAAGLGGGSSDAAACIKGINKLLTLNLSSDDMKDIGLEIGSDVPFFFSRGQAEITGRGENVREIELPTDYRVILVTPRIQIRAREAYGKIRFGLTNQFPGISLNCCHVTEDFFNTISDVGNDLERPLRLSYPVLDKIREGLKGTGADIVRLSGSGPTIFALFGSHSDFADEKIIAAFEGEGWGCRVASPAILPA
jgi:4-diphosphocytidyl-2-C-methyl-D-erythritol kinase